MAVASKNIFHFTGKYETLVKILESKSFWPRYCCEYDWFTDETQAMFIPMVCFTDIPIAQAYEHMDFYGHYGIGLTKAWASSKNICPVWYVKKKTLLMILSLAKNREELKNPHIIDFLTFCKRGKGGRCKNRFGEIKQKDFYDEREWRYIPPINSDKKLIVGKESEKLGDNDNTWPYRLNFTLSDIRYLFVDTEDDRVNLIGEIERLLASETPQNKALLKSRIITFEQLKNDF